MEGVGSRLGRASSRYGQTTTVFNGPVRRWKKKWVHVPSSSSVSYHNSHSHSNGHNNSRLLLRRWTPISPTTSAAEPISGSDAASEEPPRRKFRYTPVSVLDEQKNAAEKSIHDVDKTSAVNQSIAATDKTYGKSNIDQVMDEQDEVLDKIESGLQDSDSSPLDLDLGLTGNSANLDSLTQMKKASSGRFWLG